MKTNRIYSILSRGLPYGNSRYGRFVQETAYANDNDKGSSMLAALTPYNDLLLRAVYAERITQFLWSSQLRDRAEALDPDNGYDKARPQFPEPGVAVIETSVMPPFEVVPVSDPQKIAEGGNGELFLDCVVNTAAGTLTYKDDVFNFTVTNGLSSKIGLIPGLDIRIRSDFADTEYVFTIHVVLPPKADWDMIRERVKKVEPEWEDPELAIIWTQDPRWDQRLAAFIMQTVEYYNRA